MLREQHQFFRSVLMASDLTLVIDMPPEQALARGLARNSGEDRFEGPGAASALLRFHLHPDVTASLAASGDNVLLRPAKGAGWQFRALNAAMPRPAQ